METITFYGTRGTSPLAAEKYNEFGGATTCILFNLSGSYIMVDCGNGVSNAVEELEGIDELHLFISHGHMDHIEGIVTLLPAFKGKPLHIYGKSFNGVDIKESINTIMNRSLWPVSSDAFSNVHFHELGDVHQIGNVKITNMDSNHPGGCSIFRLKDEHSDIVTAFDFCHLDGYDKKLIEFAKGCKTLIYDGTFTPEEITEKGSWGHSTPEMGAEIGKALGVEELIVTHFGVFDDDQLSAWEYRLREEYPFLSFARTGQRKSELQKMVDIGTMLSSERDGNNLLLKVVEASMDITGADGGTLYLLEDNKLEFKVIINKSKQTRFVRKDDPLSMPAVSLDAKNICAAAAREKTLINVENCYEESNYDFSGAKKYDELNHYHTQSVLAIPLIDENNDVIGVLQLINATSNTGKIISFREKDESVLRAIANQAALAIINTTYSEKINDLLYGFVKVMSTGIDERTPYNANHTKNMVKFADRFFDYEEEHGGEYKVDPKKRREILMSIWLHDTGKVLIPLSIMNKDSRLGEEITAIENRFDRRDLLLRIDLASKKITEEEYDRLQCERANQLEFIKMLNNAGFLASDLKEKLDELAKKTYTELDGSQCPIITQHEYHQLSIVKGTLTAEERNVMENHVVMTQKLLSQLNFPKYYDNIPAYAGNHHEFLDGSGYPNHLSAKDLPWPGRLITVCDIFEALVAKDRPYKKPMPIEKAFAILYEMVDLGKLDRTIVEEFERSKVWEE